VGNLDQLSNFEAQRAVTEPVQRGGVRIGARPLPAIAGEEQIEGENLLTMACALADFLARRTFALVVEHDGGRGGYGG
jgi:hypothetical protein